LPDCFKKGNQSLKDHRVAFTWIILLAVGLFFGGRLRDAWQSNLTNLRLLKGQDVSTTSDCSHVWLVGIAAGQRAGRSAQRQAMVQALGCSPAYLSLVQAIYPKDQEMAQLATQYYTESSKAWFWLGETKAPTDQLAALQAYLRTVALAPYNGLAWCRLGYGYEQMDDLEQATNAFLNCCRNNDPGSHGCYGAGLMMEQLGNLPQAIAYYRLSHWEGALKRAQELEASLKP
jgi:tetratricopeptide (TPR) repeat protein